MNNKSGFLNKLFLNHLVLFLSGIIFGCLISFSFLWNIEASLKRIIKDSYSPIIKEFQELKSYLPKLPSLY